MALFTKLDIEIAACWAQPCCADFLLEQQGRYVRALQQSESVERRKQKRLVVTWCDWGI